jgi:hypothetical protein
MDSVIIIAASAVIVSFLGGIIASRKVRAVEARLRSESVVLEERMRSAVASLESRAKAEISRVESELKGPIKDVLK